MNELKIAEKIAEGLRQRPYRLFHSDCLTKSLKFRAECRRREIRAHVMFCVLGLTKAKLPVFGEVAIPYTPHFWGEVKGQRFETSRPLGSHGHLGIIPSKIRPLVTIRLPWT